MKSILLIEDNAEIRDNLKEYLEMEGYRIYATNQGKMGNEMALQYIPDLIICDMPEPGIDGHEVLRLLLKTTTTCEIPFIFCTTLNETFNRTDALALGADDYIVKPFELDDVLAMIKYCIRFGSKRRKLVF